MKELDREHGAWILYELHPLRLVLSVNCGTIASYDVNLELDFEEREQYMAAGRLYLENLARRVVDDPRRFWKRSVTLPEGGDDRAA